VWCLYDDMVDRGEVFDVEEPRVDVEVGCRCRLRGRSLKQKVRPKKVVDPANLGDRRFGADFCPIRNCTKSRGPPYKVGVLRR
jgi:hypothetical protein